MRYGAWYLKTNLWKKQRADEPLVDPKISHKAQDANFEKHLREQVCKCAEIWLSESRMITAWLGTEVPPKSQGICIKVRNRKGKMSYVAHVVSKT